MRTVIGADLGGTNVRLALVDEGGKILKPLKQIVGIQRSPQAIVTMIATLASDKKSFLSLGMGVPGIVSAEAGIVYSSPHYPEWTDFKIADQIQKKIKKPVFIDNDANLVALGEHWKGVAKDWKTFMMLTLGTGIGGGILIDSKLFRGNNGFAGEFGHMVVEAEGPPCACGSRGCLEVFASASGIHRMIRRLIEEEDLPGTAEIAEVAQGEESLIPFNLSKLAREGHPAAKEIFDQFGYYLGIGLASLVNVTGIQNIVLGGGLIGSHDLFLPEAKRELKNRTYAQTAKGIKIRLAKLRDDAGILGAAKMAFEIM